MSGGSNRLGSAELGPHAPKELAEVTLRSLQNRLLGLKGGLEMVQAAFKEFSNNAIRCPKCGHVVRWGEAKLQAQERQS
jgi:hypothetical protein